MVEVGDLKEKEARKLRERGRDRRRRREKESVVFVGRNGKEDEEIEKA